MSRLRCSESHMDTLTGAALLYGAAVVLLASARLENPAASLAWAAGWSAARLLPLPGGKPARLVFDAGVAAMVFLVTLSGSLESPRSLEQGLGALALLGAYLSGHGSELPRALAPVAVCGLCAGAAVTVTAFTRWGHRRLLLGGVFLFALLRWNQYMPGMEEALFQLAAAGCFTLALNGGPSPAAVLGHRFRYRLGAVLVLIAAAVGGGLLLSRGFPLAELNQWVSERAPLQAVFRNDYRQGAPAGFQLSDTEWQPLGDRLGGPVSLRSLPVMTVRASVPGLYLRGQTRTRYTGVSWAPSPETFSPAPVSKASGGAQPFFLRIHPLEPGGTAVFAPLHTDTVTAAGRTVLRNADGIYRLRKRLWSGGGADYEVTGYLEPQNQTEAPETLAACLQLPALPDVVARSARAVAGGGTPAEQMDRLSAWLSSEGIYSLTVPVPEPDQDFVGQFLAGGRKGYCTYFATALAVMGRTLGIPTRYVEGYRLPAETAGRQTYLITSDRAHAWAEAWIEGRGWVTYDPTPSTAGTLAGSPAPRTVPEARVEPRRPPSKPPAAASQPGPERPPLVWVAVLALLSSGGLRVLSVRRRWAAGSRGPAGALWELYGALSALALLDAPDSPRSTPSARLAAARKRHIEALETHDIIGESDRLLYGGEAVSPEGFRALRLELWHRLRREKGPLWFWWARYGSLELYDRYFPLIRKP